MRVVRRYGTMWARNEANIAKIPSGKSGGRGVYVLFDGSMPMYVGKGNIRSRIKQASTSEKRRDLWDHFSWYAIKNPAMMHDIEVLMLRILPPNLRFLTHQGGNFKDAKRVNQDNKQAVWISRKPGPQR
jgi:predicted RNA-binding protein YlxR (DUF448 family)